MPHGTPASSQIITLTRMLEEREETMYAQAAVIEKLREALLLSRNSYVRLIKALDEHEQNDPEENLIEVTMADEALASLTDSTQILAEVRRAERERCAKVCEKEAVDPHNVPAAIVARRCAESIRAME